MSDIGMLFAQCAYQMNIEYYSDPKVIEQLVERGQSVPTVEWSSYINSCGVPQWERIMSTIDEVESYTFVYEGVSHTISFVDQVGGEGQGDEFFYVFDLDGTYYKVEGYWISWDGVDWSGASVYPVKQKVIEKKVWVEA